MKRLGTLLIAVFAAAGCVDDERYFCISDGPLSERGCFLCTDDDECIAQPPPPRATCFEATDCAVEEICTNIGCVAECEQDAECPLGTECTRDGICLNPLEDTPTRVQSPSPSPTPTPTPAPAPTCQFNFECGDGRICIDGECLFTCLASPCPDTQQCMAGACRPCMDDVCLSNCSTDADCSDLEYCSNFQCVPDTRPVAFCPENECQPGRVCVRGQCRTPCESDEQCAQVDGAIRFCAPVGELDLCVRSIEVLAECQLNIDCAFGEECVDGSCAVGAPR